MSFMKQHRFLSVIFVVCISLMEAVNFFVSVEEKSFR